MTAQISDSVEYRGSMFSLAGIRGEGLFKPHAHGFSPRGVSSLCWRGYHCHYEVAGQSLLLQDVTLWQRRDLDSESEMEREPAPTLFGKPPVEFERKAIRLPEPRPGQPGRPAIVVRRVNQAQDSIPATPTPTRTAPPSGTVTPSGTRRAFEQQTLVFKGMGAPMPFTGGVLLARDFVERLYVHMGFHPAWKFRTVHELLFQEGRLVNEFDRSEQMEHVRERMIRGPLQPGGNASEETIKAWIEGCFSLDY
jgi:hypothetical protein